MRIKEFITEASTLTSYGVDKESVTRIHTDLNLQHDAQFSPVANKAQAAEAVKNGKVVIAINDKGEAYGLGQRLSRENGYQVLLSSPNPQDGSRMHTTLSSAMKIIPGRVYKMYISDEVNVHSTRGRRYGKHDADDRDYGSEFDAVVQSLNPVVKKDAKKALGIVRRHLTNRAKQVGDENFDGEIDFESIKKYLKILRDMAEGGVAGWADRPGSWGPDRGQTGLEKEFFSVGGYGNPNWARGEFQKNHKLAAHKFIKYVRNHIQHIKDRAVKGVYNSVPGKADEYTSAQDTFDALSN